MNDKVVEYIRYNNLSQSILENHYTDKFLTTIEGVDLPLYLQAPFKYYHQIIRDLSKSKIDYKQIDLCCGNGLHSFTAAYEGASVTAIDFSENSIKIAKLRSKKLKKNIDFKVGDVELLSIENNSIDLVTMAGSFSYLNHDLIINEIYRVLKKGGSFVCIDSYNHNLIYRLNRYIHYLRGQRSKSTLEKMPNENLIFKLKNKFKNCEIKYFGIFIFLSPLFLILTNENRTYNIIKLLDEKFYFLNKLSFKIVLHTIK
jgi:ubiquinone/menaquinone biosynthesis C-methylase UbiE